MRPGSITRGSTAHEILTELERYPDTWYQAHQFPTLTIQEPTIKRTMARLITERKVASRLVVSDDPDQRGVHHDVIEIKSRDD